MKAIEFKYFIKDLISKHCPFFYHELEFHVGIHNLPTNGKWYVCSVAHNYNDYEVYFKSKAEFESFKECIRELDSLNLTGNTFIINFSNAMLRDI